MNKYIFAVVAGLLIASMGVGPVQAESLTLTDQVSILQASTTPLEDFAALQPAVQQELVAYFNVNGVPVSIVREFAIRFPVSRLRYGGYTDIMQTTLQYLGCISVANSNMCVTAKNDGDTATSQAETIYPGPGLHNGIGDAFRHCLWSALMTYDLGGYWAALIASKHEELSPNQTNERSMDIANNNTGRQLGAYSASHNDAKVQCRAYADAGLLVTL